MRNILLAAILAVGLAACAPATTSSGTAEESGAPEFIPMFAVAGGTATAADGKIGTRLLIRGAFGPNLPESGPLIVFHGPEGWNDGQQYEHSVTALQCDVGCGEAFNAWEIPPVTGTYWAIFSYGETDYGYSFSIDADDTITPVSNAHIISATSDHFEAMWDEHLGASDYGMEFFYVTDGEYQKTRIPRMRKDGEYPGIEFTIEFLRSAIPDLEIEPGQYVLLVHAYSNPLELGTWEFDQQYNMSESEWLAFEIE